MSVLRQSSCTQGKQQHAATGVCPDSLLVSAGTQTMPGGGTASCAASTAERQAALCPLALSGMDSM